MDKITFSHVFKKFKNRIILEDVCIGLEAGNIYGIIGPNGSGKTVLLKLATGLLYPTKGKIYIDDLVLGESLDFPPKMGLLIETPGFLSNMTGLENLEYLAKINNVVDKKKILQYMDIVGISDSANLKVGKYSLGMKQRLAIAQSIMENPDLIILDEPMNGLDVKGVARIQNLLIQLKNEGKLIILASHVREDIKLLCDEVYYIQDTKVYKTESLVLYDNYRDGK